jgi:hypothetical protein
MQTIKDAQNRADACSTLYLTDASQLYVPHAYPANAPGLCCHIDDLTNEMLPPRLGTQRPTNGFSLMKVERAGAGAGAGHCRLFNQRPAAVPARQYSCTAVAQHRKLT